MGGMKGVTPSEKFVLWETVPGELQIDQGAEPRSPEPQLCFPLVAGSIFSSQTAGPRQQLWREILHAANSHVVSADGLSSSHRASSS